MMTCVSLRSGMASSGNACIDHHPPMQASAAQASTSNLCRTEKLIMRLIMSAPGRIGSQIMFGLFTELLFAAIGAEVVSDSIASDGVARGNRLGFVDCHAAGGIFHRVRAH